MVNELLIPKAATMRRLGNARICSLSLCLYVELLEANDIPGRVHTVDRMAVEHSVEYGTSMTHQEVKNKNKDYGDPHIVFRSL